MKRRTYTPWIREEHCIPYVPYRMHGIGGESELLADGWVVCLYRYRSRYDFAYGEGAWRNKLVWVRHPLLLPAMVGDAFANYDDYEVAVEGLYDSHEVPF
jgi:hypothetical protein